MANLLSCDREDLADPLPNVAQMIEMSIVGWVMTSTENLYMQVDGSFRVVSIA